MRIHTFRYLPFLILHLFCVYVYPQKHIISGVVQDQESGLPIEDVTVYINGTTTGTTTNSSGQFHLEFVNLPCELILSHISYQLKLIPLQDPVALTHLSFILEKRIVRLEEATVVTTSMRTAYLERFRSWFIGEKRIAYMLPEDYIPSMQ